MKRALWLCLTLALGCGSVEQTLETVESELESAGIAHFHDHERGLAAVVHHDVAGHGAIVGRRHVLTVAHVMTGRRHASVALHGSVELHPAVVVADVDDLPEHVLLLEVDSPGFDGFAAPERLDYNPGGVPHSVLTVRGLLAWEHPSLQHGDSGSPVVDADGRLVGLLVGRRGETPVCAPLDADVVDRLHPPAG